MATLDQGYDTRSRILAAARRLFAERGYAATSLADIAAAVGLTKTAVAYHFHPKDRLAGELMAPAAHDVLELLTTDFGGDARAFIEALIDFAVRHRAVIRLLMEDVGGLDHTPPGPPGETIRAYRHDLYAKLAGPAPDDALRVRAWAVVGALQHGIVETVNLPEETVRQTLLAAAFAIYGC